LRQASEVPRTARGGSAPAHRLTVHAFADSLAFARQLARALHVPLARVVEHQFPDGESLVRVASPASREAVVVRTLDHPDAKLFEVLLAADALRRAGARRVTLVAPYLPYMRQDKVFAPGEPISQRVVGAMLGTSFDRVLTLEAHLHRISRLAEVIPCRARSLTAAPALADWVRANAPGALIVGPDAESRPWVRQIARAAGARWAVGRKERLGDRTVKVHLEDLPTARRAIVIDDIASSGATLAGAAAALTARGIATVDAIVVHAIFAPGALTLIRRAGVRRILSCDTVVHPSNAIRCAPLVARALEGPS
jgi:ribose-phosphate pyrophosphokinase